MTKSDPLPENLYSAPLTFMNAPHSRDISNSKAVVLGIPFDCGTHPFRIGSRQGPRAIREQSMLIRPYNPELADYSPVERLGLVDCGDVRLTPSRILDAFDRIEAAMHEIVVRGAIPITMGGDGSVSLPQLRAVGKHYADLAVIHIDSHTDTNTFIVGDEYNAGTQFTHAALEKMIDPTSSFHIGIRGTTYKQNVFAYVRSHGYQIITLNELFERGFNEVLGQLREALKQRPVYICLDMDVFDPSCAPGVAAPSWGGITAREGINLFRGLAGLNIVAVDVNTISPPHDHMGMAAFLAANMMYEAQILLCRYLGLDRVDVAATTLASQKV